MNDLNIAIIVTELQRKFAELRKQIDQFGLYLKDRKLFICECGLMEKLGETGLIFTYYKRDKMRESTGF